MFTSTHKSVSALAHAQLSLTTCRVFCFSPRMLTVTPKSSEFTRRSTSLMRLPIRVLATRLSARTLITCSFLVSHSSGRMISWWTIARCKFTLMKTRSKTTHRSAWIGRVLWARSRNQWLSWMSGLTSARCLLQQASIARALQITTRTRPKRQWLTYQRVLVAFLSDGTIPAHPARRSPAPLDRWQTWMGGQAATLNTTTPFVWATLWPLTR